MAILVVCIHHLETLRMNEFFDYAGACWALSQSRDKDGVIGADLEDFYDGTVQSSRLEETPVIFVYEHQIVGWYRKAMIYRYIRHPALFLEGNICANIRDVRFLKQTMPFEGLDFGKDKAYLVIETGDTRYDALMQIIADDKGPFEVLEYAKVPYDERLKQKGAYRRGQRVTSKDKVNHLLTQCECFAEEIMNDTCTGIGTVKALAEAALAATRLDAVSVNAWYYLAMAYYQAGFVQKGLKAIDRAIRLEPDADDLLIMKGNLMVSKGCFEGALSCYEEAYRIYPEDTYYIMAGKACSCMGNPMAAENYYRKVKDTELLKTFGISLGKKKQKM